MKVTTKIVFDSNTWEVLEHEWFEYDGPVAECKKKSKSADQAAKAMMAFAQELVGLFRQQFGAQEKLIAFLEEKLKPFIESTTGFLPGEEAALRTGATEEISGQYEAASRAFQEQAFVLGGRDVPSGAMLSAQAALGSARAQEQASAQRQITLAGAHMRRQQAFTASAILGGLRNPNVLAGLALQGYSSAADIFIKNKQPSLLGQIVGGLLGAGASFLTGGLSTILTGATGAAAGGSGGWFGGGSA